MSTVLDAGAERALDAYRWFHRHPELSNQEASTAAHLAGILTELGFTVHTGIGGHGVVATLKGRKAGPGATVLYRADMDALPVTERTELSYQSEQPGVMHACGHDIHMAVAVLALQTMAKLDHAWSGTIVFVAQPAEELGEGARRMLADPQFADVLSKTGKPSLALALHDSSDLPAGTVALSSGYTTANVDSVDITFFGKGGHGAKPHEAVDPIVMASEAVLQFQTIVSRRIAPSEPAVVTVGKLSAGTKHNIIPPTAELQLTVRSYADQTRAKVLAEIEHIANKVAEAYHAPQPPTFEVKANATPSGFNDEVWTERLRQRFEETLGKVHVKENPPGMVGEDFALYSRTLSIPGVLWRLGAVNPTTFEKTNPADLPGLHSDEWAPDAESAVPVGARSVVVALFEGLGNVKSTATKRR